MNVDVARLVGAVTREIGTREVDGKLAKIILATRDYDTDIDDLWDALTNAERIPRWFLPIEGDLRLGGHFQFKGNAGGNILKCEPPRVLAITWGNAPVSWVTLRLSESAKGTRLELEHVAHVDDALWDQFGPGAVGIGWDLGLMGLALHLSSSASVSPEAAMAWQASAEGKSFMTLTSDDWCRASIAAGADPEKAKAAAKTVTGFYTGGG